MNDLIERLRAMVGSDMVPMEKAMNLLLEAANALEAARTEREVIVKEAMKYADKAGRLKAERDRLEGALRAIEEESQVYGQDDPTYEDLDNALESIRDIARNPISENQP